MAKVRAARADEAEALTGLVMRSKAHWGYDPGFLAACADDLRIRPQDVVVRRIVVAEDERGAVLGLASLEGTPPRGVLGLLFVEPAAIGLGVGRLLYADVLRRAVELGVRRLAIDSDPHAAGFYRAMGAVAAPGGRDTGHGPDGLVPFEVAPVPLADWAREWTGGGQAVHLGNVAEFNAQFADATLDREQRPAHHYACLAAFYSPHPAVLVLPRAVPREWTALVGRQLGWSGVEVYDGLVEAERGPGFLGAVRERPALAARLTGAGLPLVPWGLTQPFAELAGRPWQARELRYESKSASHEMFGRILAEGGHPGIVLPAQWRAGTRWAAVRLLSARARAGEITVLKSEHGVGGSGTTVVTPAQVRAAAGPAPCCGGCRAGRCWWRSTSAPRPRTRTRAISRTTASWTPRAGCTRPAAP